MKLINYPNPILKTVCSPVIEFNEELHNTLDQMKPIMLQSNGIGLAANQVGITQRFFLLQDIKGIIHEFINPIILEQYDPILSSEGCLSMPGVMLQIPRYNVVLIEAQKRNGETFRAVLEGIEAVCFQHEFDHLNGVFFLDQVNRQQRRKALRDYV